MLKTQYKVVKFFIINHNYKKYLVEVILFLFFYYASKECDNVYMCQK